MNYFELFGINRSFLVDQDQLDLMYFKKHHDKNIDISYINNAYKILKDDLLRAEYLLECAGVSQLPHLTPENLEHFLELNEKIENKDIFLVHLQEDMQMLKTELADYFQKNNLDAASQLVSQLKYLDRVIKNAKKC